MANPSGTYKVLTRVKRPCHGDVLSVNLVDECPAGCLHCRHGRGVIHPGNNPPDFLVAHLVNELEHRRRRGKRPAFVIVGANGEPFPRSRLLRETTVSVLEALLKRQVGVAVETRGWIPDEAFELMGRYRQLVRVRVAVLTMDPKLAAQWEPETADPQARMFNLQRLRRATVPHILHLAPVIPFINDDRENLIPVLDAARSMAVKRVSVEILRLFPGVDEVLGQLGSGLGALVLSAYLDRTTTPPQQRQTLPVEQREELYENVRRWASKRSIHVSVCKCNDPQIGSLPCSLGFGTAPRPVKQMGLFSGSGGHSDTQATSTKSSPSIQPDFPATSRNRSRTR